MRFKICLLSIFLITAIASFSQSANFSDTLSPEKAIKYYKSILQRNKNSSFAYFGLASAYFVKKDYQAALKYSKHNIKEPNDYRAESYVLYASSLDRMGRISEAIDIYEKALKLYPENYQVWYEYALSCYKYRNYDKSLQAVKRVIVLQPLFVPAHYLYGCTLFESSNNRNCVPAFLFALLLDNDSLRSQQAIAFVNEYLKHDLENINIPFFETRLAIIVVDNILYYYISEKVKHEIFSSLQEENLCSQINDYLKSIKEFTPEYQQFYYALEDNKYTGVLNHYVLRMAGSDYIKNWYLVHKDILGQFAGFLNKNLPGK